MSFKVKKFKNNIINDLKSKGKEKQELKKLIEKVNNPSLSFALIKLTVNLNFLPLSIESYYEKIFPDIEMLRKKDGSKYSNNSINTVKSALVCNKLFVKKENKLYELNINEAIKYIKSLKETNNISTKTLKRKKNSKSDKDDEFLGKKRAITKNLIVNKYEKLQHGYQILNDLLESYPKKNKNEINIKTNFNKYESPIDLIEKTLDNDKICGMLITFKYFKPFLKKFLYSKNISTNLNNNLKLNQQISDLKDGLDLVQFCIKKFMNPKNNGTDQ